MSGYTPTTDEVREAVAEWCWARRMFRCELEAGDGKEFDRWLASVKAEAIRGAAIKAQKAYVDEQQGIGYARVRTDWLHAEATRIEQEQS